MNLVPDSDKTKEQLIAELEALRAQVSTMQQAAYFQDITESLRHASLRKQAQEALLEVRNQLEIRVEERIAELSKANELRKAVIAERQGVEEKLRLLESAVVNANDAIIITEAEPIDEPGPRILYANPAFTRMTGFRLEELLGKTPRILQGPKTDRTALDKIRTALAQWQPVEVELLNYRKDGSEFWIELSIVPVADEKGWHTHFIAVQRDITERKRAEAERDQLIREQAARIEAEAAQQRSRFLAEASAVLASSLDYEITLKSLASLVVPTLADWCSVELVEEDGSIRRLPVAHANPSKAEWARQLQQYAPKPNSSNPIARVLRTGQPELIPELPDSLLLVTSHDSEHLRIVREMGIKSAMIVPLVARQQIIGTITFVTAESDRRYSATDLAVAEDLVRCAALAIDNARLYQEAQQSRQAAERAADRTVRLQTVTAALSESLTPPQVAEVIVAQGVAALGASSALVALLNENGSELEIVGAVGYEQDLLDGWRRFPINTPVPLAEAVRTGETIWEESTEKRRDRYPHLAESYAQHNYGAWISLPLMVEGRAVGGISLSFTEVQELSQDERAFILALAQQCAQALDRARLYEAERTARARGEAALSAAQAANRIKDQFLAIVSHELRTPLNSILGWSQMLRNRKLDEATMARAFEIIERNARLQNQLIEDLLDVSRIIRGKVNLNIRPVDLVSIIEAAIDAVRLSAEAKNIRVETRLDSSASPVLGDSERLQQVVWNLLSNAIKFTPEGSRIEVRLQRRGFDVQIQVIDTGIGISADFLPHVFEYFRQADGTITRSHGGLGLGLAIVRHLVELHGGTVQAESQGKGQGATFTVKLPILEGSRGAQEPGSRGAGNFSPLLLSGLRVLVVDDEADTREFLTFMLEQYGVEVTAVASADEALQRLEQLQPDILISDIGMPREDGYTLLRKVRALESQRSGTIPAIALTAYAREEDRRQALAAGFQMHVSKPVEVVDLAVAIANLAGRTGQV